MSARTHIPTPILTRTIFHSSLPLPHCAFKFRIEFVATVRTTHPQLHLQTKKKKKKKKMDGHDGEDPKQSTADMTVFVQNLLQQMQTRFQQMSDSIVTKIDEMGGRINELEQSINDLRAEMGVESSPSPVPPTKPQLDDVKKEEGSA